MGRITLGDVMIAGLLTVLLVVCVVGASGIILFVGLGISESDFLLATMATMCIFLIIGGVALGMSSTRAGYPVLSKWAWGAVAVVVMSVMFYGVAIVGDEEADPGLTPWFLAGLSVLLLGLFFTVGLAGLLNARYSGMPTRRFRGTRPGGGGFASVTIYKSNQPAIYQGVRELDFDDKAPGSLYRRRQ